MANGLPVKIKNYGKIRNAKLRRNYAQELFRYGR